MTQVLTVEEYRSIVGTRSSKKNQSNDLAMVSLICELAGAGYKFGGVWRKGMEVEPSTVYLEYTFSDKRRFRADLSIPTERIILEIHGGNYIVRRSKDGKVQYLGGAHHSPEGRRRDMEKSNLANIEGWTYLEVEWKDVKDGSAYELITKAMEANNG